MRDATAGISEIERVNGTRTGSEGVTGQDGRMKKEGMGLVGRAAGLSGLPAPYSFTA